MDRVALPSKFDVKLVFSNNPGISTQKYALGRFVSNSILTTSV